MTMNTFSKLSPLALALVVCAAVPMLDGCKSTQPAGVQMNDSAITTKVKSKMTTDSDVKARNIDVTTDEGVVYLTGRVESQREKDEAERIARETDGVTKVVNHLKVGEMKDTQPASYDKN
jgi:hyperosmotically inducible protein